ncbi:hypothetical protein FQZ97_1250330 [compost metagenome]
MSGQRPVVASCEQVDGTRRNAGRRGRRRALGERGVFRGVEVIDYFLKVETAPSSEKPRALDGEAGL